MSGICCIKLTFPRKYGIIVYCVVFSILNLSNSYLLIYDRNTFREEIVCKLYNIHRWRHWCFNVSYFAFSISALHVDGSQSIQSFDMRIKSINKPIVTRYFIQENISHNYSMLLNGSIYIQRTYNGKTKLCVIILLYKYSLRRR